MSNSEDRFFDRLEAHIELLESNPTEINQASIDFIFSFLKLAKAQAEQLIALKESLEDERLESKVRAERYELR